MVTSSEEQEKENTLRLPDLATICLGYMVMSSMVFMWRGIINAISNRTNTQILLRAKKAMRVIAAVVKVCWLVVSAVFFLLCCCDGWIGYVGGIFLLCGSRERHTLHG